MFKRYAIYFAPDGDWGDFGASWLGWDCRTGVERTIETALQASLVARPGRYGFHATIKAPFRLADGESPDALAQALEALVAEQPAIPLTSLMLAPMGRILALKAPAEANAVSTLAARVVRDLDPFRAPLTGEDRARRRPERLSETQRQLLDQWGYPHVMDEFDFHLTLTGPFRADVDTATAYVREAFDAVMQTPLSIDALSLMGEDAKGRFHQIERFPLLQV